MVKGPSLNFYGLHLWPHYAIEWMNEWMNEKFILFSHKTIINENVMAYSLSFLRFLVHVFLVWVFKAYLPEKIFHSHYKVWIFFDNLRFEKSYFGKFLQSYHLFSFDFDIDLISLLASKQSSKSCFFIWIAFDQRFFCARVNF